MSPLRKILVVDDDAAVRRVLCVAFALESSVDVREAADGDAALRQVVAFHPDVVVLDEDMPKRSGTAVAPAIRVLRPGIRIVAFSGMLDGAPAWADVFVSKGRDGDLASVLTAALAS